MAISAQTKYPDICKDIFLELQDGSADLLAHHSAVTFSLSSVKAANDMKEITDSPILSPVTYMVDYAKSVPAVENASTLPVSYTHLDVYKRQVTTFLPIQTMLMEIKHATGMQNPLFS